MLLGTPYCLGERHVGGNLVEDEVERTAQHCFDFKYLVARVDQVVDGADDGQSGTHVGFVAVFHATCERRLLQFYVVVVVA